MTTTSPTIPAPLGARSSADPLRPRDLAARILLWACAVAAALAALSGLPVALAADPGTRFVELWRVVGFATFATIFSVIAASPRSVPLGIWLAVIANKLVLSIVAVAWSGEAAGADSALWWDGSLTVALITALALTGRRR